MVAVARCFTGESAERLTGDEELALRRVGVPRLSFRLLVVDLLVARVPTPKAPSLRVGLASLPLATQMAAGEQKKLQATSIAVNATVSSAKTPTTLEWWCHTSVQRVCKDAFAKKFPQVNVQSQAGRCASQHRTTTNADSQRQTNHGCRGGGCWGGSWGSFRSWHNTGGGIGIDCQQRSMTQ